MAVKNEGIAVPRLEVSKDAYDDASQRSVNLIGGVRGNQFGIVEVASDTLAIDECALVCRR